MIHDRGRLTRIVAFWHLKLLNLLFLAPTSAWCLQVSAWSGDEPFFVGLGASTACSSTM